MIAPQDMDAMKTHAKTFGLGLLLLVFVASCATGEQKTADRLAAAGDWDAAVAAYREAAKKDPFDDDLHKQLEQAKVRAAEQHYAAGRRLQKEDRLLEALEEFKLALGLDPSQSEHHAALGDALRLKEARDQVHVAEKLQGLGRLDDALEAYERAVELDPSLAQALEGITAITEQQRSEKTFGGATQPITLRFQNAKLKEVFEILARAGGINVMFDKDLKDDPITIFIKDTPFNDALNLILSTNSLFARRIGPDTLLIMPNTKQKQDQYQDLMIRTFYLSTARAKDMVNLLRTMLESKRVYVNESLNAVVIRDQPEKLRLAERIILANDRRDSEVEFDLEVLEVNRTKSLKYGFNFGKTGGVGVVPPGFTGSLGAGVSQYTFRQLTSLSPSSYLFTFPSSVLLDFFKQESDAKTLASPKIRVLNNKQASINIGEKQPILLSTTNVLPGQAATGAVPTTSTVTSIEFKDTGVKLTVEPIIHLLDELTLKLKIEVTRIGDQVTLQATPEIKQFRFGTRTAETTLNIKNDESVVLAGLIQDEDRKSRVTVPGLGDIPIIGELFSSTTTETITTEVVLTITPHIVRNVTTPGVEGQAFWSGTETNYSTSPMFSEVSYSPTSSPPSPLIAERTKEKGAPPSEHKTVQAMPGQGGPGSTQPTTVVPLQASGPATTAPLPPPAPITPQAVPNQPSGATSPPLSAPSPVTSPSSLERTQERGEAPAPPLPVAGGAAVLALRPPELSTFAGQEFRTDLTVDNMESLSESVVTVAYDPQVIEFRRAMEGDLLKRDGGQGTITLSADPTAGRVQLRLRRHGPPVAGTGVLAALVFQAKTPGASSLDILQPTVTGASNKSIPVNVTRGQIRVR
jgi:general secretion pathway protein D